MGLTEALITAVTVLAGTVAMLWRENKKLQKKLDSRTDQLLRYAEGVSNGSKQTLEKIANVVKEYEKRKAGKANLGS